MGPLQIDHVLGIIKAYSTRVGSGPFPTELDDDAGRYLLEKGHEFGTTTGRQRRCGWLDAVPLRYSVAVNSVSDLMVNKLDILSGLQELRIATSYEVDGTEARWPLPIVDLERARPVYEVFRGWDEDISGARSLDDLPANAIAFIDAIERAAGAPVAIVSVGPERSQTIHRQPFHQRPRA